MLQNKRSLSFRLRVTELVTLYKEVHWHIDLSGSQPEVQTWSVVELVQ